MDGEKNRAEHPSPRRRAMPTPHTDANANATNITNTSTNVHANAMTNNIPALSGTHGKHLACFRPRHRFSLRPTCRTSTDGVCSCAHEPLQCRVLVAAETSDPKDLNSVVLRHAESARRQKWSDKYASHDWHKHSRSVCQKWREYQPKLPPKKHQQNQQNQQDQQDQLTESVVVVTAEDQYQVGVEETQKTSPSRVVKNALTTFASAAELLVQTTKFDTLVRSGIPLHLRGEVWWRCSGAAEKRASASRTETYAALVRTIPLLSKRAALEIEKDLPRTFPHTDTTQALSQEETRLRASNMHELRRVLQAYCLRNPSVGYCQSMNFLAAVLLQYMEEDEAFWVLASIIEELIPHFHSKSMVGSRAEQRVFGELVQLKLPLVYDHMQVLGVDLEPFTLKWFLCLFLNTLPLEPVMRVWDVFFCEGSHVLLRVGLTILKLSQARILACDDAFDVYEMFKFDHETLRQLTAPYRTGLLNRDECVCDTLVRLAMDKSFLGAIAFDALHELRHFYRNDVAAELKAADERRGLHRATDKEDEGDEEEDEDEEDEATFHLRHVNAARELLEYDFVEEYAYYCGDVSPSKHIYFGEVRGGSTTSLSAVSDDQEVFVAVDYTGVTRPPL